MLPLDSHENSANDGVDLESDVEDIQNVDNVKDFMYQLSDSKDGPSKT